MGKANAASNSQVPMGKGTNSKMKHKPNPSKKVDDSKWNKQRESDERKTLLKNKIEIKRLLTNMNKAKDRLEGRVPPPPPPKTGLSYYCLILITILISRKL